MARITHHSGWKTDSGFRLIRIFSIEHNAQRLRKHCQRLRRSADPRQSMRFRVRMRRRRAGAAT